MNQKKSKVVLIIIIVVIAILAILVAGIAYAYFATDIFKSNKELFFKYTSQIGDTKSGLINNELSQYFEKKNQMSYEDSGTIDADISSDISGVRATNANNFNITFSGRVDTPNSKAEQDISINYSENTKFPISYRQTGNLTGLQTSYIGNKYITVENDNFQEVLDKINGEQTGNNILTTATETNIPNIEFSEEDKSYLLETYMTIINEQLTDNNFSKTEESGMQGYKLSLSAEEIKNILTKLFEKLKDDERTLEIINKYATSQKITSSTVNRWLKNIENTTELENEKFEMTVYNNNGQIAKFDIQINEMKISVQKSGSSNELKYDIEYLEFNEQGEQIGRIALTAQYNGLQALDNVEENYSVEISTSANSSEHKYAYTYKSNVKFSNDIKIEDLTEENAMILNNYDTEVLNNFVAAITQRITLVNEQQMQDIGVSQNENPILDMVPSFSIYNSSVSAMENSTAQLSEIEITTFNQKFEMYESTNARGVTVKGLLSTIQASNEGQEDEERKIQEINFDGQEYEVTEQNITLMKSSIETESSYRVEFEKNQDTGVIYRAVINKK